MSTRLLMVFALTLFLSPTGLAAQSTASRTEQGMLMPGDSVRITVHRNPEVSGDFVVGPDSSVTHPLLRSVKVGGVPFAVAESNLRSYLATLAAEPRFTMEPMFRISVLGQVNRPQTFAARPATSIADAVALAGGPNDRADRDHVRVVRTDRNSMQREFLVDLSHPDQGLAATPIRSGDMIVMEQKHSFWQDIFLPTLSVAGSLASIGLLITRYHN